MGTGVNVRVGVSSDWDIVSVDVTGTVRVARRRVAVGVDVMLGVAVDEGVRAVLGVGVSDETAVAMGEGSGVALEESRGEGGAVAARVGNGTRRASTVTG